MVMAKTGPVRYSLLLLGGGSITAYAGSASLATAHLSAPVSATKALSAQSGTGASAQAANSSATQVLSKAQGKERSARATVLALQQQLQTLQQQLGALGESVPTPSPGTNAPQASQPTYVAPTTMPPTSTMTGASGIP